MPEPSHDYPSETGAIEAVMAATTFAPYIHNAGSFEHAKVSCRCRPTMLEPRRQVTRRQLSAKLRKQQDYVSPCLMRECEKYHLHLLKRRRILFVSTGNHVAILISANGNN